MSKRVAVLIASRQGTERPLPDLAAELSRDGFGAPRWLEDGVACELALPDDLEVVDADRLARRSIGPAAIDVAIVPSVNRRKRLLIADMDSTMIEQECIDELAAEVGRKDEVAAVTAAAMRGEIPFDKALRDRVATLAGLDASVVDKVLAERITLRAGGRELVATMRANGAHTMLVSGGFTLFTRAIASTLGFDENRANTLVVEDGRFTGTVAEPILGRDAKLEALREGCAAHGITPADALAVGDGANDLAMVEASGLGVALHAKPAVAARAHARIDHGDLTVLLFLQGYSRDEFVTDV